MPQGKMKTKAKSPAKGKRKAAKGPAVTKRANKPITPKKQKTQAAQKLKKVITKTVNNAVEEELRSQALDGRKSLRTKKQAAPAPATPARKKAPRKAKK
ncbi:histone H1B [Bacillus rossius redtenbacheri]|uniref:histone H1B n=1 Tax=Bacillus rossius redtenbacheri TaxID=93214 RepID=UPI002FDD6DE5